MAKQVTITESKSTDSNMFQVPWQQNLYMAIENGTFEQICADVVKAQKNTDSATKKKLETATETLSTITKTLNARMVELVGQNKPGDIPSAIADAATQRATVERVIKELNHETSIRATRLFVEKLGFNSKTTQETVEFGGVWRVNAIFAERFYCLTSSDLTVYDMTGSVKPVSVVYMKKSDYPFLFPTTETGVQRLHYVLFQTTQMKVASPLERMQAAEKAGSKWWEALGFPNGSHNGKNRVVAVARDCYKWRMANDIETIA